ncbi:hypothetical protein R1flu_026628 [Riccia fluitans]|uniref:Uncharacterized protein n=1 Tax=Riccia fluitans TaxID=41844 RepID=A0ABD1XGJ5_9MARC
MRDKGSINRGPAGHVSACQRLERFLETSTAGPKTIGEEATRDQRAKAETLYVRFDVARKHRGTDRGIKCEPGAETTRQHNGEYAKRQHGKQQRPGTSEAVNKPEFQSFERHSEGRKHETRNHENL